LLTFQTVITLVFSFQRREEREQRREEKRTTSNTAEERTIAKVVKEILTI